MKRNLQSHVAILIVCIAYSLLSIITCCQKQDFFIDEIFSYGLSNCQKGMYMSVTPGQTYSPSELPWLEYMSVNYNQRFDYQSVWRNQEQDVHPPLYYALLHTLCSFSRSDIPLWPGILINIVFGCLTVMLLFRMAFRLTKSTLASFSCALLIACSSQWLSMTSYIRMYVMAMFFATWINNLILRVGDEGKGYVTLGLAIMLGGLTHYYVLAFALVAVVVTSLLSPWRKSLRLWASLLGGILGVFAIFPGIISHVAKIGTYKDGLLFATILQTVSLWIALGGIVLILACIPLIRSFRRKPKLHPYIVPLVSCIVYVSMIYLASMYFDLRYFFPVYTIVHCVIFCLLYRWVRRPWVVIAISLAVYTLPGYAMQKWHYLYADSKPFTEALAHNADCNCVVMVGNPDQFISASLNEVRLHRSATFVDMRHADGIKNLECINDDTIVLYLSHFVDPAPIFALFAEANPNLKNHRTIGSHCGEVAYLIAPGE